MSDPKMIKGIQEAVSIPVMAKCRIGHFAEAQILQAIEIDYIDESEVLSPADDRYHIDKTAFRVPFVCGAKDLGEALRRIAEGASMIRTKGEPGTGDVVQAVRQQRYTGDYTAEMLLAELSAALMAADDAEVILPGVEATMHLLELLVVIGGADMAPAALSLVYQDEAAGARAGLDWTRAEVAYGHPASEEDEDWSA